MDHYANRMLQKAALRTAARSSLRRRVASGCYRVIRGKTSQEDFCDLLAEFCDWKVKDVTGWDTVDDVFISIGSCACGDILVSFQEFLEWTEEKHGSLRGQNAPEGSSTCGS